MKQQVYAAALDGLVLDRCIRDYSYNMVSRHFHRHYEIYYLAKGERFYFIDKQTYLVREGSLVFIDRNQIHKTGATGSEPSYHDRILISLEEDALRPYLKLAGFDLEQFFTDHYGVLELDQRHSSYVEGLLDGIAAEIQGQAPGYEFMARSRMAELFLFASRHMNRRIIPAQSFQVQTARHRKVDEVAGYIAAHYNRQESLDDLSRRFFVSKCYLSRIFKEVTGFTVNEYISIHRVKQAQILLSTTDYSITEIADMTGYESITYFEKVFKRYTETSPLKYRKQQRTLAAHAPQ